MKEKKDQVSWMHLGTQSHLAELMPDVTIANKF